MEQNQHALAALFQDVYAAAGYQPQRHLLERLLTAAAAGNGSSSTSSEAGGTIGELLSALQLQQFPGNAAAAGPGGGGPAQINLLGLVLSAALVGVNGIISLWLRLGLHGKLAVAAIRCILQLSVLGFILVPIFNIDQPWLTGLYALFMLTVAAIEAVSRPTASYPGMLLQVLGAMGIAASLVISYGLAVVVQVHPWYSAQYMIPMLGMLLGNACSGVAVGLSSILDEFSNGRDRIEQLLALGATRWEAARASIRQATRMALMPLLNQMNVIGVVSIPGMMTGQILGGSDPATAARYQIIIMFLIAATTAVASVAAIHAAVYTVMDGCHRLRSDRLSPRASTTKGAVSWVGAHLAAGARGIGATASKAAARVRLVFGGGRGRRHSGDGGASSDGSIAEREELVGVTVADGGPGNAPAEAAPSSSLRQPLLGPDRS